MNMNRLIKYYSRIFYTKRVFNKAAKKLGLSKEVRKNHNKDIFKYSYAKQISRFIYSKNGDLIDYSKYSSDPDYIRLIKMHESKVKYTPYHWNESDDYIKEYVAEMYSSYYPKIARFSHDVVAFVMNDQSLYRLYYVKINSYIKELM